MLDHLLKAGDRVRMRMSPENRSYGQKGVEDGTLGTVLGRVRAHGIIERRYPVSQFHEPGVYSRDTLPIVRWDEYPSKEAENDVQYNHVSPHWLEPADTFFKEYKKRYAEEWPVRLADGSSNPDFCTVRGGESMDNLERTGDLPETKFWELDVVLYKGRRHRVCSIRYNTYGCWKEHAFEIEEVNDNNVYMRNSMVTPDPQDLALVERGNVWNHAHGKPLVFRSLIEEGAFYAGLGEETTVSRNDNGPLYWEETNLVAALTDGTIDGFTRNGSVGIRAMRYKNREFGERLRQANLSALQLGHRLT